MNPVATAKLDSDLPIVQAMREGDRFAFEEFVRRHGKWVRGVIYGVLGDAGRVDDVSQQVWTTVWQQVRTLEELRYWRTWLYRLVRNAAVDAGREKTRRRKLQDAAQQKFKTSRREESQVSNILSDEQQQLLQQAIHGLSALYREPFVLRHLEGWNYQQIAQVLDLPVDTVETRLVRARRQLREALKDKI